MFREFGSFLTRS